MNINSGANSIGTQVNRYLDSLGLPDNFGDKIGALVDLKRGDLSGLYRNIADLKSGLSTGLFDRIAGARGRRSFGRCHVRRCRPHGPHLHRWSRTYVTRNRVGKQAYVGKSYSKGRIFGFKLRGRISGRQYRGSFGRPIRLGKSGYLFKGRMYRNMGAIRADLRDGRVDGVATRVRTVRGHRICNHPHVQIGGLLGRSFTPNWNPAQAISGLLGQGGIAGAIGNAVQGAASAAPSTAASGASAANDTSSVLSNPNMTLEDKLMMLMARLSEHMDKEIENKMKEVEKAMSQQNQKKSGGGGLFGSIGKIFKSIPIVGGLLGGGSKSGGAAGGKKPNLQLLQSQLQSLMQKRQQMFQTMQNIMKSLHDTSMAAVRNLKA